MVERIPLRGLSARDRRLFADAEAAPATDRPDGGAPPKFDINLAGHELLRQAGLDQSGADQLRVRRPLWHIGQITALDRVPAEAKARLRRLFTVAPLTYCDKASGRRLSLTADLAETVVAAPAEELEALVQRAGDATVPGIAGDSYLRFRQSATASLDELEAVQGGRNFPAFLDGSGLRRHLDPAYLAVQAVEDAPADEVAELLQALGLIVERRFATPGLFIARLTTTRHGPAGIAAALGALAASPTIRFAEPAWIGFGDLEAVAKAPDAEAGAALPWNLAMVGAARLWSRGVGTPQVLLAAVDTGVDAGHPAIAPALFPATQGERRDFTGLPADAEPVDENGHGTAVAGLLVGNGGAGAFGLAPGCRFLPLRVPLSAGLASYALRRDALMSLVPRAAAGERIVVNLSWRTAGDVALVRTAIEALHAAGAIVACSAGNGGGPPGTPHFPSDYPVTISVAAVGVNGQATDYTDRGAQVDLAAPGGSAAEPLLCAAPGGTTAKRWGTSFAAPHVAGAAALVWSLRPELDASGVRALLQNAAHGNDPDLGHGLLDLARLADALTTPGGPAPLPETPAPANPQPSPETPVREQGFPMPGQALAALGAGCGLKPITARILGGRRTVTGWSEVAAVLGMTAPALDCLRRHAAPQGPPKA